MKTFDIQLRIMLVALIVASIAAISIVFTGCTLAEINIVNRTVLENGEGVSSNNLESNLEEETNKMELLVPLK